MIVMDPVFVPTDCCWTVNVLVVRALVVCGGVNCSQAAGWTAPRRIASGTILFGSRTLP
jgi:hypothetical protein